MNRKAILLVEDNPDDELLTLDAMKANKISNPVAVARNGADALEYLFAEGKYRDRSIEDTPALVLLDLKLPKVDGFEVLRRIRLHPVTRLLPVVILTSSIEDEDRLKGYSLGANSYVRKPVEFDEFVNAVGQLGLYWLLINLPPDESIHWTDTR